MIRKVVAGVAVAAGLAAGVGTALPANAEQGKATKPGQVINLRDNGYGACQKPGSTWGVGGALAVLTITDKVTWPNRKNIRVSSSDTDAVNTGCSNGYPYNGGTKRLVITWTVQGQGISSCNIGIGGNCSLTEKQVTDGYDTGTKPNTDGEWNVGSGGGSVTADGTAAGRINNYTHSATATFAASSKVTIAKATNNAYIGF
ncbi:hypothetical protein [Kribbella sp. C-35]|uniref:hypothetical protein n=1 Tax=Kribbella sp. C-35 TaxID=2789276 RepID=UPI00397D2BEA